MDFDYVGVEAGLPTRELGWGFCPDPKKGIWDTTSLEGGQGEREGFCRDGGARCYVRGYGLC